MREFVDQSLVVDRTVDDLLEGDRRSVTFHRVETFGYEFVDRTHDSLHRVATHA
jgi:hypothetical protein